MFQTRNISQESLAALHSATVPLTGLSFPVFLGKSVNFSSQEPLRVAVLVVGFKGKGNEVLASFFFPFSLSPFGKQAQQPSHIVFNITNIPRKVDCRRLPGMRMRFPNPWE